MFCKGEIVSLFSYRVCLCVHWLILYSYVWVSCLSILSIQYLLGLGIFHLLFSPITLQETERHGIMSTS